MNDPNDALPPLFSPEEEAQRIEFDDVVADFGQHRLFRHGAEVHLSPKALRLLRVLARASPNAVSKQELHEIIWPDVFVSETTLAGIVVELRNAIGDDARNPRYIRTVHSFGYAFSCSVRTAGGTPAQVRFRLLVQGRDVPLRSGQNRIGRSPHAEVFVDHVSVSRDHARISEHEGAAAIEDLGSKNGTFVNGVRVREATPLHDRDTVGIGMVTAVFRDLGITEPTVTVDIAGAAPKA